MAHSATPFSDTTKKNGLIQECEFWTGLGDGAISGDTTLLKVFTSRINQAFDRIAPYLYSFSDYLKWDDTNNTDLPIGTFNIVSGQSDYTIAADANSLAILNITGIRILPATNQTFYMDLAEVTADDPMAATVMSPNPTDIGTPRWFLKKGNTIYLFPQPNYSSTNGAKISFEREISYFASTDTTKEAGIPRTTQGLLPLYASYDWLVVNLPANGTLITRVEAQIAKREQALKNAIDGRYPARAQITTRPIRFR